MLTIVTRHNINMDIAEVETVIRKLAAQATADATAVDPDIKAFEIEIAAYHGVRHAVATSSGRTAQYVMMKAMGIPAGAEVIVPAYSFYTVPTVVEALGCIPVFAPCHPLNYALDPDRVERFITPKTAAVIVEHPFGQPAPVDRLRRVCDAHKIPLIEDVSQSIGAALGGRKVGTFGRAACMSLVHGKNLMTFGGGALLTDDDGIAASAADIVRAAGPECRLEVSKRMATGLANWALTTRPGFAAALLAPFWALNLADRERLDGLFVEQPSPFDPASVRALSGPQAALGRMQLTRLDARNAIRRHNAERLISGLRQIGGVTVPEVVPGASCTWNAFAVRIAGATDVQRRLMIHAIDSRADYMTVYAFEEEWNSLGDIFYLPNHPGMNDADVDHVVKTVGGILISRK